MRYQIRHARVQFGGDVILRDVNFEVHDREKIAIVGRNGCGKTTLLKLIAGDIEMSNLDSDEECGITMAGAKLLVRHEALTVKHGADRRSGSCGRSTLWTRR